MATNYRYIGVTDECVECQQCGKPNLKSTIVLAVMDVEGNDEEVTYFGSSCAAKALGIKATGKQVKAVALNAHRKTLIAAKSARETLAYYGIPESGDVAGLTISAAVAKYKYAHRSAAWFFEVTDAGWIDHVEEMTVCKRAAIRDAALLGY